MWGLARHALAVLVLPGTVLVLVPIWIARAGAVSIGLPASVGEWALALGGVPVAAAGLVLFVSSLARFGLEGRGTLAPWDPPRHLVVRGPYAYVRNPMISGVVLLLLAEAMVLASVSHFTWALAFVAINATYIPLLEEPLLRAKFGQAYETYCMNVPRLLPRRRPWVPGDGPWRGRA